MAWQGSGFLEVTDEKRFHEFLTSNTVRDQIFEVADAILGGADLSNIGAQRLGDPVLLNLARQFAESKSLLRNYSRKEIIGVVFGMWKESARLKPSSPVNPNGEDCLNYKLQSLEWLLSGTNLDFHIYAVDDNCPDESIKVAKEQISRHPLRSKVTLCSLAQEFPFASEPLCGLASLDASNKGGAVIFGCQQAIHDGCSLVCTTDCDNAVPLGQLGLLIAPILSTEVKHAVGCRFVEGSVDFWHPKRTSINVGSRILIHLRRVIPLFDLPVIHMAMPYKAYDARYLAEILPLVRNFDFTFDVDLSLISVSKGEPARKVECTEIDSYEESVWHHFGDSQVQYQRLIGLIRAIKRLGLPHRDDLADLVLEFVCTPDAIRRIVSAHAPNSIETMPDSRLGDPNLIDAESLRIWFEGIGLCPNCIAEV